MRPPNSFGDGALVLDESLFAFNVSWLKKTKQKKKQEEARGLQVSLDVLQENTCGVQTAQSLHSQTLESSV